MDDREGQLTIASNRLPVVLKQRCGRWSVQPGSGGLVQAMAPVLKARGGRWVGWPGVTTEEGEGWSRGLAGVGEAAGYDLGPVVLDADELEDYYEGFANSVLWPLFHGFPGRCCFSPEFYEAYGRVNQRFAEALTGGGEGELTWIHDYHLLEVARRLRQSGHRGRLAFFLHIPFPSAEIFSKLPWRERLLTDLLHFDLIGFQTERDVAHFQASVERLGIEGEVNEVGQGVRFELGGRAAEAAAFPISIDYRDFAERAASQEVSRRCRELAKEIGPGQVLLGIDRLDYSKGLIHRLQAYERALEQFEELREEVVFFQLVVPSRENVPEYRQLKREFDRMVGRINGRFSTAAWQPIHYLYNRVDPVELSALYRLASVALVTPLRDGMNLVAKEYCASQVEADGVLVLSEFAGAAEQLAAGALLVNPYDTEKLAEAIHRGVKMDRSERRERMTRMQAIIEATDVYWWARAFLERASKCGEEIGQLVELTERPFAAASAGTVGVSRSPEK